MGFLSRCCSGKGPHFALRGESHSFPRGLAGSLGLLSSCDVDLRVLLILPQGSQFWFRVVMGTMGFLASHCMGNRPHLDLCPETPCSSPVATGILGLHSRFTWGVRPRLELKQRALLSSWVVTGISWSPLSGLKGVKPPMEFWEGTRDCSLGPAGKEGPHLVMTGESHGFSRVVAGKK